MNTQNDAKKALTRAWPLIVKECRKVLGSELHYQAMIYHCLRDEGKVPIGQIGMNVKMAVEKPKSKLFKELEAQRHPEFQGEFEPIPDIVLFKKTIRSDWRRRNNANTLTHMLMAIEVKASELKNSRLTRKTITRDIDKLTALREESRCRGGSLVPVMMVIDTAPDEKEQIIPGNIPYLQDYAIERNVGFFYLARKKKIPMEW